MTAQRKDWSRVFPGAPLGAWVCEEGWLVIGDQAWTEAEWRDDPWRRPASTRRVNRPYPTEEQRRAAVRRVNRESMRRRRAKERARLQGRAVLHAPGCYRDDFGGLWCKCDPIEVSA